MANVMSFKNIKNRPHRSAFDLSFKNAFTANVGELLPLFVKEILPGDEVRLNPSHFTRTSPVNSAAYTRIRENVDFFFVPYRLLWDKWTQFIAQTNDPHYAQSAVGSVDTFTATPYTTDGDILRMLKYLVEHDYSNTPAGQRPAIDATGQCCSVTTPKLLQLLGYGAFAYQLSCTPFDSLDVTSSNAVSMFRLLAYQKIYYDHFRNSQWETSKPYCYNLDYVFNNSDLLYDMNGLLARVVPFGSEWDSPFTMRYANYSKDLTMGLNPSPQFGESAIAGPVLGNLGFISNYLSATNPAVLALRTDNNAPVARSGANNVPNNQYFKLTSQSNTSGISVLAIRLAESLQKYREITLTGSKDYRDQIQKHWGVSVPDYASDLCERVYSYDSMIEISEVVSNNLSSETSNANIKGKGVSAAQGGFTWKNKSNDYGVMIGIYHAEPLLDYQSDLFVDRTLMNVAPSSFPQPEFDSVGMEAVPLYSVFVQNDDDTYTFDDSAIGYAPRYFEYKTSRDIINGGFGSYGKTNRVVNKYPTIAYNGGYCNWVSGYGQLFGSFLPSVNAIDYRSFKIQSFLLNPIFVAQKTLSPQYFDGDNPYPDYSSDQLLVKAFFDCKVLRNLSYDGLPY